MKTFKIALITASGLGVVATVALIFLRPVHGAPSRAAALAKPASHAKLTAPVQFEVEEGVAPPPRMPVPLEAGAANSDTADRNGSEGPTTEELRIMAAAQYESESVDRGWATSASAQLQNAIQKAATGASKMHGIECRSTVCRVDIVHESEDVFLAFTRTLADSRPWPGPMFATRVDLTSDGRWVTQLYMGREGKPLVGIAD